MKKGLLTVSFGTSFEDTRKKTLDRIDDHLRAAFPDRAFYRAWSSRFIVKKVRERDGFEIDTPQEALERMLADGVTEVLVQPTYVTDGFEYERLIELLRTYTDRFEEIRAGRPLLYTEADRLAACRLISRLYPEVGQDDRLVLMGHGVPAETTPGRDLNGPYRDMNRLFAEENEKVYMALVEAEPSIKEALEWLEADPPESGDVYLAPFLLVVGDHARNDMAGDEEESWKNTVERAGYKAVPIMRGLAENPVIPEIYEEHAKEADRI